MTAMKGSRELGRHVHHSFDDDLETPGREVLRTGGVVEEQLVQALDALTGGGAEKARGVIAAESIAPVVQTSRRVQSPGST